MWCGRLENLSPTFLLFDFILEALHLPFAVLGGYQRDIHIFPMRASTNELVVVESIVVLLQVPA